MMDYYFRERGGHKLMARVVVVALGLMFVASCSKEPTDSKGFVEQGQNYYQNGEVKSAVIAYKNALIASPDDAGIRTVLGEIYVALGDGTGAEKELSKALRLKSDDPRILINLGKALLLQGKYHDVLSDVVIADTMSDQSQAELLVVRAKAHFALRARAKGAALVDRALQKNPESVAAHVLKAKERLLSGDEISANTHLDQAILLDDKDPEALLLMGDLAMKRSDISAAKPLYQQVIDNGFKGIMSRYTYQANSSLARANLAEKDYSAALKYVKQLLAFNERDPNALYLRSMIAYETKEYESAEDYLERLLSISPGHKPSLLLMGAVKYVLGSFEQANKYLSQYIAADPDDLFPRKLLGATRLMLEQPEEAYDILSKGLAGNADDQQLITLIGAAAIRSGNYQLGKEYIDKVLPSSPANSSLRSELAMAYLSGGNADDVIDLLAETGSGENSGLNEQMALVAAYLQKRDYPKVLDLARQVTRDYPDKPNGYIAMSKIYMIKGDFETARNELQRALKHNESSIWLLSSIAELEYRDGRPKAARDYFEKAYSLDQKNERIAIGLAQIYMQLGQESDAIELMEALIRLDDKAVMPRMLMARHYLRNGDIDAAERYLSQVLKKAEDATSAKMLISQLYLQSNRPDDAAAVLNQLVREDASIPSLHMHAQVHLQLGNDAIALDSLKRANRLDPDNGRIIVMLAAAEAQSGNFRVAHKYADQLIKNHPDKPVGYSLKGDFYAAQGEFEKALSAYNDAEKFGLNRALSIRLYQMKSKLNQRNSVASLKRWVEKNPGDLNIKTMIATDYLGRGENQKALNLYNQILAAAPDNYLVHNNVAWIHYEMGDIAAGKVAAAKAYALKKDDANVLDTYGWLLFQAGDDVKAEDMLSRAYTIMPDSPDIQYHYAAVLAKLNKPGKAKELLLKALDGESRFSGRSEAERLLKKLD